MNTRDVSKKMAWSLSETLKREKLANFSVKRGRGAHNFTDEDIAALEAVNPKENN